MFSKRIPIYYVVVSMLLTAGLTFVAAKFLFSTRQVAATEASPVAAVRPECNYDITRLTGYRHISPILSAIHDCEAEGLMPLKMSIASYVEHEQAAGSLTTASVYIRRLSNDEWIDLNPEASFHPASLLKVPQLIAYLKMAETQPGLLDRQYKFVLPSGQMPTQYFSAKTLQPGHKYSVKELFHFMIVYSDNYANIELVNRMDMNAFNAAFTDLRMTPPNLRDRNYTITSRNYSRFLEALYNASYLSIPASEYATELLADAYFKDGIIRMLPKDLAVAHKMGEWGDGQTVELHDCGIVYHEKNPYVITIMTRGNDMNKLPEIIGNISRIAYDAMNAAAL